MCADAGAMWATTKDAPGSTLFWDGCSGVLGALQGFVKCASPLVELAPSHYPATAAAVEAGPAATKGLECMLKHVKRLCRTADAEEAKVAATVCKQLLILHEKTKSKAFFGGLERAIKEIDTSLLEGLVQRVADSGKPVRHSTRSAKATGLAAGRSLPLQAIADSPPVSGDL